MYGFWTCSNGPHVFVDVHQTHMTAHTPAFSQVEEHSGMVLFSHVFGTVPSGSPRTAITGELLSGP